MEPTLENVLSRLIALLNSPNDARLSGISQLLESGTSIVPIATLKESKQSVQDLATSAPDLFLNAAAFYYAKFIQTIEIVNLSDQYALIPCYLKLIKILIGLRKIPNFGEVDFEPFLRSIIDSIKEVVLSYENIGKTFEFLNILKSIQDDFAIPILGQKEEYDFIDLPIQEYVESEEDISKSYSVITKIKEGWGFDLFLSEGSWIEKTCKIIEEKTEEDFDKNLIKDILILLKTFKNEYFPEIEENVIHFCEKFELESSEIFNSEPLLPQDIKFPQDDSFFFLEFSPIFENHLIYHRSQFKLNKPPMIKIHNHISVWKGCSLLNLKGICVKEYTGNRQEVIDQYIREVSINQSLSEIGSSLYLEHFGHCEDGESHFLIMELCKKDLKDLISDKTKFSRVELAYFSHLLIKGLSMLKSEAHIYHRDIKPENIMISFDNEFKLIDFNISTEIDKDSVQVGLYEHSLKGTPEYSSPEKLKCPEGQNRIMHSRELNDVYSLGLVILEMTTLDRIAAIRRANEELFYQKMEEQISQIQIPWLSNLLKKMLNDDYNFRPRFEELLGIIENDEEFINDVKEYHNKKASI